MATAIRFGTDGWRAVIGEDFTFDNVRACAQSVALFLKESGLAGRGLVVGYDTRFASEDFAAAVAEVVAANDIKVYLCDRACPTQTVSYGILDKGAGGAVVITASHNPWRWNGLKYKPEYAGSASPEVIERLEAPLPQILASGAPPRTGLADAERRGLLERFDPRPAYLAQLARLVACNRTCTPLSPAPAQSPAGALPSLSPASATASPAPARTTTAPPPSPRCGCTRRRASARHPPAAAGRSRGAPAPSSGPTALPATSGCRPQSPTRPVRG
jgi:hypothetical protein